MSEPNSTSGPPSSEDANSCGYDKVADYKSTAIPDRKDTGAQRKTISLKPITKPAINFKLGGGIKLGGAGATNSTSNGLRPQKKGISFNNTSNKSVNASSISTGNKTTSGSSIKKLGKPSMVNKVTPGSVFGGGDSDSEEEEMPMEAKMRMRNVGKDTVTSAGPNSFYKTKKGFTDPKSIWKASEDKLASQHVPEDEAHR